MFTGIIEETGTVKQLTSETKDGVFNASFEGDQDGLMKGILEKNGTPAAYVGQIADCVATVTTLFGK